VGALPHRATDPDLLIVARWPGAGERDHSAEAEVDTVIALITEIRDARATAKLPAAEWLETRVAVPVALGPTFEGAPNGGRTARPRTPTRRELTDRGARGGFGPARRPHVSMVVACEIEAAVRTEDDRRRRRRPERHRLVRDLAEPRAGWLLPGSGSRTSRSSAARRPRSSRAPGRAKPSSADQVARLRERTRR
jgi:hypothetical protein